MLYNHWNTKLFLKIDHITTLLFNSIRVQLVCLCLFVCSEKKSWKRLLRIIIIYYSPFPNCVPVREQRENTGPWEKLKSFFLHNSTKISIEIWISFDRNAFSVIAHSLICIIFMLFLKKVVCRKILLLTLVRGLKKVWETLHC